MKNLLAKFKFGEANLRFIHLFIFYIMVFMNLRFSYARPYLKGGAFWSLNPSTLLWLAGKLSVTMRS